MARFRRFGRNHEGRAWVIPESLEQLADQIEATYPTPHGADGTVASAGHDQRNPRSDHRPDPHTGAGVVRAIDIGEHHEEGFGIAEAIRLSRDARVKYVIHERRMFASYSLGSTRPAWEWRPATGHVNHVHVSTEQAHDADDSPWDIGEGGDSIVTVEQLQEALNTAGQLGANGRTLTVDGIYGPNTAHAHANGLKDGATAVDTVARSSAARANTRLDNV